MDFCVMEQYHDHIMVDECSVLEKAHEIQSLTKELDHFKGVLHNKFSTGGIIAKIPPS